MVAWQPATTFLVLSPTADDRRRPRGGQRVKIFKNQQFNLA